MSSQQPHNVSGLDLEFPQSLAVYDDYAAAQKAVDFLSDNAFPVQNCMIVGTDLKQVERITGRLTKGRVALAGALSGLWLGLFVGLIFSLFGEGNLLAIIGSAALVRRGVRRGLGTGRLRRHPRPARLLLRQRRGGDEVRGAGRAQAP